MARIHRLQQVERLTAADFPDYQPVGAHSKRCNYEVSYGKFAFAVFIGFAGFKIDAVALLKLEFACVLQHENAVVVRNEPAYCI